MAPCHKSKNQNKPNLAELKKGAAPFLNMLRGLARCQVLAEGQHFLLGCACDMKIFQNDHPAYARLFCWVRGAGFRIIVTLLGDHGPLENFKMQFSGGRRPNLAPRHKTKTYRIWPN